jgi:hypothetical protein
MEDSACVVLDICSSFQQFVLKREGLNEKLFAFVMFSNRGRGGEISKINCI